jgi:hypothetical protein
MVDPAHYPPPGYSPQSQARRSVQHKKGVRYFAVLPCWTPATEQGEPGREQLRRGKQAECGVCAPCVARRQVRAGRV